MYSSSCIPEGSVLGSLLFIIYVNDIQDACLLGSSLYMHADDSKLFRYISNVTYDISKLQSDLDGLNLWFSKWSKKLNINKCKTVSYGRQRLSAINYSINNIDPDHLGVNFDFRLNFSGHMTKSIRQTQRIQNSAYKPLCSVINFITLVFFLQFV
jgi:hypothetical protein